jgi:hypothetical protein
MGFSEGKSGRNLRKSAGEKKIGCLKKPATKAKGAKKPLKNQ